MKAENLMFLLFIINISLITVVPITAQVKQPSELTKDDNVTATIKPQGTSIGPQNETSLSEHNSQMTSAGNVTSTIKPQGTSIGPQNETSLSEHNSQMTSAGNVTSTIKPQGTSTQNANNYS
jgi:hypothetical protein